MKEFKSKNESPLTYLEMPFNPERPKEIDEHMLTHRFILVAEPQVGKTGAYLCLLQRLWSQGCTWIPSSRPKQQNDQDESWLRKGEEWAHDVPSFEKKFKEEAYFHYHRGNDAARESWDYFFKHWK